ncbi:MAG: PIN domain-containing protein [Chloroflexota bacterium]
MTIFIDTSAIYALLDRADDNHERARLGQERVLGEQLVTHSYVVVETISLVRRRLGPPATVRLVDEFLPAIEVHDVDERLRLRAIASFRAAVRTDVSLVDRTSFEFMREQGITRAFAVDADFETAGFELVS